MATNLYIILKDAPIGTCLYSPFCGFCNLRYATKNDIAVDAIHANTDPLIHFDRFGHSAAYPTGKVILFPSEELVNWDTWQWYLIKPWTVVYSDRYAEAFLFIKDDKKNHKTWFINKEGKRINIDFDNVQFATKVEIEYFTEQLALNGFILNLTNKTLSHVIASNVPNMVELDSDFQMLDSDFDECSPSVMNVDFHTTNSTISELNELSKAEDMAKQETRSTRQLLEDIMEMTMSFTSSMDAAIKAYKNKATIIDK